MKLYRMTLTLESAFGTPLVGDTLFGQVCWGIRHRFAESKLTELLATYTENRPFLVLSDAFPTGYIPLPTVPSLLWAQGDETDRKALKKKKWLAISDLEKPFADWQKLAKADSELTDFGQCVELQAHNQINRATATTSGDGFAPYMTRQTWYGNAKTQQIQLDIYALLDESKFSAEQLKQVLQDIGTFGYGRDASIGLGKFSVTEMATVGEWPRSEFSNAFITLANCCPMNNDFVAEKSFYQLITRFGRHGDAYALKGQPFKKPIILAKAGALLTPKAFTPRDFVGNGLDNISTLGKEIVHQGYAPVIPVQVDFTTLSSNKGEQ